LKIAGIENRMDNLVFNENVSVNDLNEIVSDIGKRFDESSRKSLGTMKI
jgi:hypothetical protein